MVVDFGFRLNGFCRFLEKYFEFQMIYFPITCINWNQTRWIIFSVGFNVLILVFLVKLCLLVATGTTVY